MRRTLWFLALLLVGATASLADVTSQGGVIGSDATGQRIKTLTVTADTNSAGDFGATSNEKQILGFKLSATSANAHCSLFDAATVTGTPFEELTEGTADETSFHIWPTPYVLSTDLSIEVLNGICTVYYR